MALLPQDPQKQKQILLMLVPVVAAVMYWNFVHVPRSEEVETLASRVETLNGQNNTMRVIVARYGSDLPRRIALFQEHVHQLEELIPRREDVPVLIHQITQRALDTGVELALIRPGAEQVGDHYTQQTFELNVLGSYHNVAEYMTAIGSLARIVRPFDVSVRVEAEPAVRQSRNSKPEEGPRLRASFRIETYVMPVPSPTEATNAQT